MHIRHSFFYKEVANPLLYFYPYILCESQLHTSFLFVCALSVSLSVSFSVSISLSLVNAVKKMTLVCYNCILYERSFSNNMISFEVIITILEIPIFYSDAHYHYSTITMSDNQVIKKDSITISRTLPTTMALL